MTDIPDHELLSAFVQSRSEPAFAEIVRRYLHLVYAAAVRVTGSPDSAEDIAQAVFVDLAGKAGSLPSGTILAGWLYRAATFTASKRVRSDQRRVAREAEAMRMHQLESSDNEPTDGLLPLLDEGLQRLDEPDRNALLLRYLSRMEFKEVGRTLGVSDEAARKRVERALERLREFLTARGRATSPEFAGVALALLGDPQAPSFLFATVTSAATGSAPATTATAAKLAGSLWTARDLAAVAAALTATATVAYQHFRGEPTAARGSRQPIQAAAQPNPASPVAGAVAPVSDGPDELDSLNARAADLRRRLAALASQSPTRAAAPSTPAGPVVLAPGKPVPVSRLTEAGSVTPEAALQSFAAAHQSVDLRRILELTAMSAEDAARSSSDATDPEATALLRIEANEALARGDFLELVEVRHETEERTELDTVRHRPGRDPVLETLVLGRSSTGWKVLPISVSRRSTPTATGNP